MNPMPRTHTHAYARYAPTMYGLNIEKCPVIDDDDRAAHIFKSPFVRTQLDPEAGDRLHLLHGESLKSFECCWGRGQKAGRREVCKATHMGRQKLFEPTRSSKRAGFVS